MKCRVKIFDPDPEVISTFDEVFSDLPQITTQQVERMLYLKPPKGIDVLYLLITAAEAFGSMPLIHKSQVLPVPLTYQENGMPAFVVTGACLAEDDPRGPIPEMKIVLSYVFHAIRAFNKSEGHSLEVIGFWAYDLLRGISPSEMRKILIEAAPELQ